MATYSITKSKAVAPNGQIDLRKRPHPSETLIQGFLFFCGALSILTTIGIVIVLFEEALKFFASPDVTLVEFFTTTTWQPQIGAFGIWPLLLATLMTTFFAMLVAVPIGIAVAIYLSEYAQERTRKLIKPTLEVLAGIPTVVYGYFALTWFTPQLRNIFGSDTVQIYNTLSAGLVMGVLILPLIATMCEDALYAVPRSLREAAYGVGATKLETAVKIVLPAATSGIAAAIILGISRAIGETMIVAIAAGAGPKFTFNPSIWASGELIMSAIARLGVPDPVSLVGCPD